MEKLTINGLARRIRRLERIPKHPTAARRYRYVSRLKT